MRSKVKFEGHTGAQFFRPWADVRHPSGDQCKSSENLICWGDRGRGISGTTPPTEMVHLSKFAEFHKETSENENVCNIVFSLQMIGKLQMYPRYKGFYVNNDATALFSHSMQPSSAWNPVIGQGHQNQVDYLKCLTIMVTEVKGHKSRLSEKEVMVTKVMGKGHLSRGSTYRRSYYIYPMSLK